MVTATFSVYVPALITPRKSTDLGMPRNFCGCAARWRPMYLVFKGCKDPRVDLHWPQLDLYVTLPFVAIFCIPSSACTWKILDFSSIVM